MSAWADQLRAISAAPLPERRPLAEAFLKSIDPHIRSVAGRLCVHYRVDRNTWLDDFASLGRQTAWSLIEEMVEHPDRLDEAVALGGLLDFRIRSTVSAFVDSSAGFNSMAGSAGASRRRRELRKTRDALLTELHREPSNIEVVKATNDRLAQTRADIVRQGMYCRPEDLLDPTTIDIANGHDIAATEAAETLLDPVDAERLVSLAIRRCSEISTVTADVARLWCADALTGVPNAVRIGRELGLSRSASYATVAVVRGVFERVCREHFDVVGV
ncbi:MAG: hypothetical protein ACRCYU_23460 [Nocardioides sp.]